MIFKGGKIDKISKRKYNNNKTKYNSIKSIVTEGTLVKVQNKLRNINFITCIIPYGGNYLQLHVLGTRVLLLIIAMTLIT